MSIDEIKDINRLKQMLKATTSELKYVKTCCKKAGLELAKNSFDWDGKEKNLVVQAIELNEKYKAEQQKVKELQRQSHCYSCGTCKGKEDYKNVARHCEKAINSLHKERKQAVKYKQALEEIKGISIIHCDDCKKFELRKGNSTGCTFCNYGRILQKCEVLND